MSALIPNISIHRIEVVKTTNSEDETCQTFVLHNEDHTIGNSLRYMIMKNVDVEYCGYSVRHPSENKINLRIQTRSKPASEVLKKALLDLQKVCNHGLETFRSSVSEFKEKQSDEGDVTMDSDDEDEEEGDEEQ